MLFLIAMEQDDLLQMRHWVNNSTLYLHRDFLWAQHTSGIKRSSAPVQLLWKTLVVSSKAEYIYTLWPKNYISSLSSTGMYMYVYQKTFL